MGLKLYKPRTQLRKITFPLINRNNCTPNSSLLLDNLGDFQFGEESKTLSDLKVLLTYSLHGADSFLRS